MKIAIFTISLGKYDIFFDGLYYSSMANFLPEHEKDFFVFSDKKVSKEENVNIFHQEKMGWPHDTMMRFHLLNKISDQIKEYDYVFFFNINMLVKKRIGDEILPGEENDWLVGAEHPLFFDKPLNQMSFDRNPNCSCYVPIDEGTMYYQGCFNGGRVDEFLHMSKVLANNLDEDKENNITPLWHDESQLNWYYKDKNPLRLPYTYIYPEALKMPGKPIMLQRDKNKHGGHAFLRS